MSLWNPSSWFSDDGPKRTDIVVVIPTVLLVAWYLLTETIAWEWLAVGFVAFTFVMGPAAASGVGERLARWFQSIGVVGRGLLIIGLLTGMWVMANVSEISATLPVSFFTGGLLAVVVMLTIEMVRSRAIRR